MNNPAAADRNTRLELALRYAARGWKLLLLRQTDDGKKPINLWREGKKDGFDPAALPRARRSYLAGFAASSDPALIRAWLDEWPDAGLAVDCRASMLFAIDLDQKPEEGKDGADALARVFLRYYPVDDDFSNLLEPLPGYADPKSPFGRPLLSRSPSGGQHLIYDARTIDPILGDERMIEPWATTDLGHEALGVKGLDIKWNGYVGIPSGDGRREWLNDVEPGPPPGWLYDALLALRGARADGASHASSEPGLWTDDDAREYLALLDVEAFRNDGAWEEVLMGLHHVTNGKALGPFFDWCMGDEQYHKRAADVLTRWKSLGKHEGGPTRGEGTLLNVLGRGSYLRDGADEHWKPHHRRAENVFGAEPQPAREELRRRFPHLIILNEIESLPTRWFWKPYLPSGMFVLSDGDPGVGKTAVAFDILARVTRGDHMPLEGPRVEASWVLALSCEDLLQQTLRPRLVAAGADMSRTAVLNESWRVHEIDKLEALVREVRPAVVYIDSVMTSMGGGVDTHRDSQSRDRLEPLARLAERYDFILWGSRHFTKQDKEKAIYAGQGTIAFTAIARSVLIFGVNPDSPKDELLMAHAKCNVGRLGPSLRYRVVERDGGVPDPMPAVEWLGRSERSADDVVRWKPEEDKRGPDRLALGGFLVRYFATRDSANPDEVKATAAAELKREFGENPWRQARQDARIITIGRGRNTVWAKCETAGPPLDAEDPLRS